MRATNTKTRILNLLPLRSKGLCRYSCTTITPASSSSALRPCRSWGGGREARREEGASEAIQASAPAPSGTTYEDFVLLSHPACFTNTPLCALCLLLLPVVWPAVAGVDVGAEISGCRKSLTIKGRCKKECDAGKRRNSSSNIVRK